jgi:hypothetical protein
MREFKEFLLDNKTISEQSIYLPADAEVVNVFNTDRGLMLLAITPAAGYENGLPEIRTFKICANGENFAASTVKYIGSFESITGNKHVIELKKEF